MNKYKVTYQVFGEMTKTTIIADSFYEEHGFVVFYLNGYKAYIFSGIVSVELVSE